MTRYLEKYFLLLEQALSTAANLLITLLMIRQLNLNYLGSVQIWAIPALTINAYATTKFYLPIASLLDELDKIKGFVICLQIKLCSIALMIISYIIWNQYSEGIGLGFLLGSYVILTDFCRYFLVTLARNREALLVSLSRLIIVASSLLLAYPSHDVYNEKLWILLSAIGTLPSIFGVIIVSRQLLPYNKYVELFGIFTFNNGGSSNIFAIANSLSGFLRSASLAYCSAGSFAAYNAFLKISNILNPILQLVELKPRSKFFDILKSLTFQLIFAFVVLFAVVFNYKHISFFIIGEASSGFEKLLVIVLIQVLFSAFCRIMNSKCRINFAYSNYIFRFIGLLAFCFSLLTLVTAIIFKDIYFVASTIALFYILQYVVLIEPVTKMVFKKRGLTI